MWHEEESGRFGGGVSECLSSQKVAGDGEGTWTPEISGTQHEGDAVAKMCLSCF